MSKGWLHIQARPHLHDHALCHDHAPYLDPSRARVTFVHPLCRYCSLFSPGTPTGPGEHLRVLLGQTHHDLPFLAAVAGGTSLVAFHRAHPEHLLPNQAVPKNKIIFIHFKKWYFILKNKLHDSYFQIYKINDTLQLNVQFYSIFYPTISLKIFFLNHLFSNFVISIFFQFNLITSCLRH